MINISKEELFPLRVAPKRRPLRRRGKPIHVATIYRWSSPSGVGGVQLETVKIGGVRYTSAEALERFIERCTAGDPDVLSQTSRTRQRQIATAERQLEEAGI